MSYSVRYVMLSALSCRLRASMLCFCSWLLAPGSSQIGAEQWPQGIAMGCLLIKKRLRLGRFRLPQIILVHADIRAVQALACPDEDGRGH
mmetsp:Transcript_540/g.1224  ORF Transcript_540/g.1224 Transcript_540/m.1224 type:complete len:90 (+) Transcript_540:1304-1573(+)